MITIHHLENSQSIRLLWLLEELEIEYEIRHYKRSGPGTSAPQEFKDLHIIGTSPIMSDADVVLPETNAIIDYILDRHPSATLRPGPDNPQRTRYLYWLHATQASLMPLLLDALMYGRIISNGPEAHREVIRQEVDKIRNGFVIARYDRIMSFMDDELGRSTWLSGDELTAADIVMGYCLSVAEVRVGRLENRPNVRRFLDQMRARPAYQRALEKNGPFIPLTA